ncbi:MULTISPECIES: TonB-dependent receptor [Sphingobium]|uniref:TonB-dependent receptor n=1 Tax=Sphingobium fuliginis (strain ATCC 27551) TaxID=336203 RepID=A0ABQ1ESZ4_SPHSA|nr:MULTISPECIES: TonB-dependent receptor [Sphingobium]AJR24616.1 TonB-dependent receptor [Sphingobium sp. YBL2]RYL99481.1 TonB-dependent receptor [Sphingobium fuliginis]WDA36690.1 TonB-dependent receptor [Sphingobium sp. YC-XJ3]GFZ85040.1 TonB-dependent receptor [Sphingobium fuliginis]
MAAPAYGQEDDEAGEPSAGEHAVFVTARRVAEAQERVPISLDRLDAADLERRGIARLADLAGVVPNLTMPTIGAFGAQQPIMRGVFSPIGASTIGLYVDDVPIQIRSLEVAGNPDLRRFDLDRVEVLRGPQGTLFGADSMGGTIRTLTRQPQLEGLDGQASGEFALVGRGGFSREMQAALGGAILPGQIGMRVSAYYRRDAGVIDRFGPVSGGLLTKNIDHDAALGLRFALKAALGERLELTPSLFFQRAKRGDLPFYESSLGLFRQTASLRQPGHDRFLLPGLTARLDLGGAVLTGVTAWLDRRNRQIVDYSGYFGEIILGGMVPGIRTPGGSYSRTTVDQTVFTQELRIASADPRASVRWLVGGFYSRSRIAMEQHVVEPGIADLAQSQLGLSIEEIFGLPLLPGGLSYQSRQQIRERTLAVFGQANWTFAPRWEVTGGLRLSYNPLRFRLMSEGPFAGGSNAVGPRGQSDTPLIPYAGLSWRPGGDSLVYLSAGKGFRGGGTNGAVPANSCAADLSALGRAAAPDSYGSDSLWSYEVGVKAGLPARRLHLSLAAFRIDWRRIQQSVTLPNCGFSYVDNLGAARNQGVELALRSEPLRRLVLDFSFGFVDARFRRDVGLPGSTIVAAGDRIPYVPRWSGTLAAEYGFTLPGRLDGFVRTEWRQAGRYRRAPSTRSVAYDPRVYSGEGSELLFLRMGLGRDGWQLSAFADNLLNSRALLYRNAELVPVTGSPLREMAQRPRTVGLSASFGL